MNIVNAISLEGIHLDYTFKEFQKSLDTLYMKSNTATKDRQTLVYFETEEEKPKFTRDFSAHCEFDKMTVITSDGILPAFIEFEAKGSFSGPIMGTLIFHEQWNTVTQFSFPSGEEFRKQGIEERDDRRLILSHEILTCTEILVKLSKPVNAGSILTNDPLYGWQLRVVKTVRDQLLCVLLDKRRSLESYFENRSLPIEVIYFKQSS